MHHFNEESLAACFHALDGRKAVGMDGISKVQYGEHLDENLRDFVRAHRAQLRIFFLPRRTPEMNPDEQVWNEIKNHRIGKQLVENKTNLKRRLYSALRSVQKNTGRILSFFQLPATQYVSVYVV
jgi:hypothetical protein